MSPGASGSITVLTAPSRPDGSIVVPHALGGVAMFGLPLAGAVPGSRMILLLQSHGLSGGEPDTTLEAMATRYARELHASEPPRPLAVLGFCMGVSIAITISRLTPDLVDRLVLIDPGGGPPSTDEDPVATFAYEQIPRRHRPPWSRFAAATADDRIAMMAESFVRKGVAEAAARSLVTNMYRVWLANDGAEVLRDLDHVPPRVQVTLVTDDPGGVRHRFPGNRSSEVVRMPDRRGDTFADLDIDTVAATLAAE